MNKGKKAIERIADTVSLDHSLLSGETIVELYSDRRVLIEGHGGLIEYGNNKIVVCVKLGSICICGSSLDIIKMTGQQLVINGNVNSVHLVRGKHKLEQLG